MVKKLGLWTAVITVFSGIAFAESKSGFNKAADYSAEHGGRAILVQKDAKVLFERYDNGWSASTPHPLASGTKSFTGIMAMMAVQDGLLLLDEKACDTLTEWKDDPRKARITVRQLLTLSSGLAPGDRQFGGPSGSNLLGFAASARAQRLGLTGITARPTNNFLTALSLPMNHDPGSKFEYGPGHFYAFGEVLQRKLAKGNLDQKTTLDYLQAKVMDPVGIKATRIGRDRAGNPNLPGGMLLTAREWAKFGQFVVDGGRIRKPDDTLSPWLKPEFLDQCFIPSQANPAYGLTWWLPTGDPDAITLADSGGILARTRQRQALTAGMKGPDGNPLKVYMAAGLGKQRLYVIPGHKVVVVRFAEGTQKGLRFKDREFLELILESIAGK